MLRSCLHENLSTYRQRKNADKYWWMENNNAQQENMITNENCNIAELCAPFQSTK